MTKLLEGKTAVIYGAGGAIGGAVATAFAREGATVYLTGRTIESLTPTMERITSDGGVAHADVVDALDESTIASHLEKLQSVDISFNAVGFNEVQGVPLVDLELKDFSYAITSWSQTVFLTSRAAARRMNQQGSGVILTVQPSSKGTALASGFGAAVAAIESVAMTLAAEVGSNGVRVLILQPNAIPESKALMDSYRKYAEGAGISVEAALASTADSTMLKRLPTLADISNVAVFAASDMASAMTGTILEVDCGA